MITTDLDKALDFLRNDDIIGFPTETVYGLAGNMYSEKAVRKIFSVKNRPDNNPLIVHIADASQLDDLCHSVPETARKLAGKFWPGPLTLLLPRRDTVPDLITAGKPHVAIRVPGHPLALSLLRKAGFPLAAPSANPFGRISSTKASHVEKYFTGKIPLVLDGGDCKRGLESTIVGFDNEEIVLYRHGSIALETLENVAGTIQHRTHSVNDAPDTSGMHLKHYAPHTKTVLTAFPDAVLQSNPDKKIGVLLFSPQVLSAKPFIQLHLSAKGDLDEAATRLYDALHELDMLNLDWIICEKFPDRGLGRTINDRLQRASAG